MTQRYLEVALPVPLRSAFTYAVPAWCNGEELVGRRVLVPFRNRPMIGVGLAVSNRAPETKRIKEIAELLDRVPALPPKLLELGQWISRYYLAPIGEAFRAMLPPEIELRNHREYWLTSEGRVYLQDLATNEENTDVEAAELKFLNLFDKQKADAPERALTETRVARMPGGATAAEQFVRRGHLAARESTHRRKTRTQKIVAWHTGAADSPVGQPEKRVREVLMDTGVPLPLEILLERAAITPLVVKRLETAGLLLTWEESLTAEEDPWDTDFTPPTNVLNAEQKHALAEIWRWLVAEKFTAALLHGVTGSGKTEVYLGAIEAALSRGKTAIVLVPEIALTLWVGRLVRARFGEQVAILHSALPDSERAREWWRARHGEARVVVGTRSAVFAPLENLGLIIVDEEQESSYKQEETPRYHGRDTAVYRARLEGAVALLGSATPSLETYHNARAENITY
jgi:primosomal protein N' (replication factor Y) (superfamily II helicase)